MSDHSREVARLWTLAQPTVSAFVASMVVDFRDRDDLLQDVAVAVIDSFEQYDPTRPFVAWAIGIARNNIRNYLRSRQRDRHVFDSAAVDSLAQAYADVSPTASARSGHLAQCLDTLGDRARMLCELRYAKGHKPAAIASNVDMSPNAVAKALQRAREQLRECVERKLSVSET